MAKQGQMLVALFCSTPCLEDDQHQLSIMAPQAWEQVLDECALWVMLQDTQEHSTKKQYTDVV